MKPSGLTIKVSVMDVEPMKAVMRILEDMIDDPEVPSGYKDRLLMALSNPE